MIRTTPAQHNLLLHLASLDPGVFLPSTAMRSREIKNPGAMLLRMAERGLVQPGEVTPQGRGYRITGRGRKAIAERST